MPTASAAGPTKPKPSDEKRGARSKLPEEIEVPSLNAVSSVPGIELAKVDYTAPEAARRARQVSYMFR